MVLRFRIKESSLIEAPADLVYTIISDYNRHHPQIIPARLFRGLTVLKGSGIGSGTRFACKFCILGQEDTLVMDVSESTQGDSRIVQEIDTMAKNITQFWVTPLDGNSCHVTVQTDVMRQPGWLTGSMVEEWVAKAIMYPWYRDELKESQTYAHKLLKSPPSTS
jgi:hypothetical protein